MNKHAHGWMSFNNLDKINECLKIQGQYPFTLVKCNKKIVLKYLHPPPYNSVNCQQEFI